MDCWGAEMVSLLKHVRQDNTNEQTLQSVRFADVVVNAVESNSKHSLSAWVRFYNPVAACRRLHTLQTVKGIEELTFPQTYKWGLKEFRRGIFKAALVILVVIVGM